ncbi:MULTISPECIES: DUF4123 domain-containing protein [Pantoea]|uniref:DUF4123 domain-containing protein n=2 Tax=Pantoea TaxID=53335 RepID=A0A0U3JYJ3_9GAMM|nr:MULTISPECIES: DUF4123 domain-containing protein [Pantoea]ALV93502.1 hypothetical protein LK04_15700 [Pantoea vagans]KHJ68842.1 hypothetical protein QU24_06775 [Pantoea rodasii]
MLNDMTCSGELITSENLARLKARSLRKHEKCWLLIDPTLRTLHEDSDLWPIVDELNCHRILFPHPDLDGVMELWLVAITPDNDVLLNESMLAAMNELKPKKLTQGRGRTICGWLISSASIDYLKRHISETSIQPVLDLGTYMLRFYDPTVIAMTSKHLDDWQRNRLFGAVNDWFFLDGDGKVMCQQGYYRGEEQLDFSLSISGTTWEKIKRAGVLNICLNTYRKTSRNEVLVSEKNARLWLEAAMDDLSHTSVWSRPEVYLPLSIAILTQHPSVYLHEDIAVMIARTERSIDKNYQPMADFLQNIDWTRIVEDCQKQFPQHPC